MITLLEETRARWQHLPPEMFYQKVVRETLSEQIKMAYTVMSVYTQIVTTLPLTSSLALQQLPPGTPRELASIRPLLRHMRDLLLQAHSAVLGDDTVTLPASYGWEGFILYLVGDVRRFIEETERWSAVIASDPRMQKAQVRQLNHKTIAAIGVEMRDQMNAIMTTLTFAQSYAFARKRIPTHRYTAHATA